MLSSALFDVGAGQCRDRAGAFVIDSALDARTDDLNTLKILATLELAGGPAVIDRFNRARNVQFDVELSGLPLGRCDGGGAKTAVRREPARRRQASHHW